MKPTQVIARDLQIDLQQKICNELNINLSTCGKCGYVLLTRNDWENNCCAHCGFIGEPCDFPDLFFEGMTWKELE